jgi:very-short-patch-repair endonuclease
VESDGTNLGDVVIEKPALNPFEVDVRDTLARRGLKLTAQYGTSGYWIDFAVQHPSQPGRYVLAIECDGATYHSSESARDRDRLRQEQPERLGWRFHRIWSSEWFHNKEAALEKVLEAYEKALGGDDGHAHQSRREARLQPARLRGPELLSTPTGTPGATPQTGQPRAPASTTRNGVRPTVIRGQPVHAYSDSELIRVLRWVESDDHLRTEGELLEEMMRELGFQRRGRNVVARLTAVIAQYRRGPTT